MELLVVVEDVAERLVVEVEEDVSPEPKGSPRRTRIWMPSWKRSCLHRHRRMLALLL